MKLSEKFYEERCERVMITHDNIKIYGEICALEAKKTLLVQNQAFMNNDRYIEQLSEATNALQEIAEKEQL